MTRGRFAYSAVGLVLSLVLIGWGGVVTTIEAGLAVPDWPTSFGSYDPFATGFEDPEDPEAKWWDRTPVLAEHGHRLLGALVGLWMCGLVVWTWLTEPRRWMRMSAVATLALVVIQGILGGLRVVWESLDLAVVHAMFAQLFISAMAALTLFVSASWQTHTLTHVPHMNGLRKLAVGAAVAVYVQIFLGALLRHPGAGVDLTFVLVHVTGSVIALGLILATCARIRSHFAEVTLLRGGAWVMLVCVIAQMILGMLALVVILYDATQVDRGVAQVVLSSAHLVVGSVLMASTVCVMLAALMPRHA